MKPQPITAMFNGLDIMSIILARLRIDPGRKFSVGRVEAREPTGIAES